MIFFSWVKYADDGTTCTKIRVSNYNYWWNRHKIPGDYDLLTNKRLLWDTMKEFWNYPIYGNSEEMFISISKPHKWRIGPSQTISKQYTHHSIWSKIKDKAYPHETTWNFQLKVECIEFHGKSTIFFYSKTIYFYMYFMNFVLEHKVCINMY